MAQTSVSKTREHREEHAISLRGTLASVFIMGIFLLLAWLGVFILFLARL
ncbi:MAG: cytochrome c oxidase subunit 2A [Kyrpidia sp.]|nr:cytochrome c oxidase subunit 2A [Kyrpidia sp.]